MKKNAKNKNQATTKTGSQSATNGTSKENGTSRSKSNGSQGSLLEKFFTDELKDIYYAEQHLLKALPKMAQASTTEELEDAFNDHLKQTERHVKRLEKVFQLIGKKPEGKKCEAIEGLTKEAESIIKDTKEGTMTRDAALIIAAQKVEHYEIATYGGLVQLAITMGLHRAADILDKTLVEEEETDMILTEIAENDINLEAEHEGGYSWETESELVGTPAAYSM
jgi:ferritin-like metal-binding protein YciE